MATETIDRQSITIYCKNGTTLRFEGACILNEAADELLFGYTSESDGRRKTATFYRENIAGYSFG